MPENKPITTMKCPFRLDKDGEFRDCYGKGCMAYCEYESYPYTEGGSSSVSKPVVNCICRRIPQPVSYVGCT